MEERSNSESGSPPRRRWFDRSVANAYGWIFGGLAGTAVGGPVGGVIGAAAPPLLTAAIQKVLDVGTVVNIAAANEVFNVAASEIGREMDDLAEEITHDPDRLRLTMSAMQAALNTYNEEKLRVLAHVLAEGLIDNARLDASWLIIAAVADLEKPHVQVLYLMQNERNAIGETLYDYWSAEALRQRLPHLREGIDPIIATLQRHGLVETVPTLENISWKITDFGRVCLVYLSAEPRSERY